MNATNKAQVSSIRGIGIQIGKVMDFMVQQSGGYGNVLFTRNDLYKYVDVTY